MLSTLPPPFFQTSSLSKLESSVFMACLSKIALHGGLLSIFIVILACWFVPSNEHRNDYNCCEINIKITQLHR